MLWRRVRVALVKGFKTDLVFRMPHRSGFRFARCNGNSFRSCEAVTLSFTEDTPVSINSLRINAQLVRPTNTREMT